MNHLTEQTRKIIENSTKEERIRHIQDDVWIGYSDAMKVLEKMNELMNYPRIYRMKSLLVIGLPENGKTAIFKRFRDTNRAIVNGTGDVEFPVVSIQLPMGADDVLFMEELLGAMMQPVRSGTKAPELFKAVRSKLRELQCKVLLIDEIGHAMGGTGREQRLFINTLKFLCNDLSLPIIAFGPEETLNVFASDSALDNRFKKAVLPLWKANNELKRYLMSYEQLLPLKEPSNLSSTEMALKIFSKTNGTIGQITDVVKAAAVEAVLSGKEKITIDILSKIDIHSILQTDNK